MTTQEFERCFPVIQTSLLDGKMEAWETFTSWSYPYLTRYLASKLRPNEVENAVQQVHLNFLNWEECQAVLCEGPTRIRTTLIRIASNEIVNVYRRRSRHQFEPLPDNGIIALDPSPVDLAVSAELARRLRRALDTIRSEYREVFELHHVQEIPLQEIARLIGLTVDGVRMRLHRAIQAIRIEFHRPNRECD